jgi:phosphoglycolate phosphatase
MPFSAILFDLDGTLLDTLTDITHAANEALAMEGFPARSEADYLRFVGDGIATTLRRALPPDRANDALVERCEANFHVTYGRAWNVHTKPYSGIPELLDILSARGIALAILSNKGDDFAKQIGETYLAPWPFRAIVGLRKGVLRKPDPTAALEIAANLRVEPASCIFVGDSAVDIQTGHAAGMFPVGVSWGFQTVEMLQEAGAGVVIDHPSRLLEILDRERDRPG